MSNKIKIIIIIVLSIIYSVMCYFYFKGTDSSNFFSNFNRTSTNSTTTDKVVITTTSSVSSALSEEVPLRTGYKFSELLVEDNVLVKKGTKIIKYTNGKYMTAPYDLVITSYNLPDANKTVTSEHYISISAYNVLNSSFRVDETKIDSLYIGKEAKIKVPALNDKEVSGYITDISSTATSGKFTVIVEYDNDGEIKLGMTVNITI